MNTQDVRDFFDRLAPNWDAELVPRDRVIAHILDNIGIMPKMKVLDVACGTGVLFPHYLSRDVQSVTGIDLSPQMIRIAGEKFANEDRIKLLCADVEEAAFEEKFDAIVVYNAFPHFPDPARLIERLQRLLKDGGRLTIAHGMTREQINDHHKGSASHVSNGLMSARELEGLFERYFDVDVMISNHEMYQVCGTKIVQGAVPAHSHAHSHSHADGHSHSHAYEHAANQNMDETRALLQYMLQHNEHHAEELAEMMDLLPEEARKRMSFAIGSFEVANVDLRSVLDCLK